MVRSRGGEQDKEILAESIKVIGLCNPEEYPIQPKNHSFEFLRENAHLRFRTNTFASVFRIRHGLTYAIHKFFNDKGFINIHTPIITSTDAEGAGEMFQVTTLSKEDINSSKNSKIDYSKDFFGKKTSLTVSGQLEAELGALSLGKVYTFGPTFRAENSNTSRHLSEFWMIEPEVAFYNLEDNILLAEKFLKYCIKFCLENYKNELAFLNDKLLKEEADLKRAKERKHHQSQLLEEANANVEKEQAEDGPEDGTSTVLTETDPESSVDLTEPSQSKQ